jgi:hypothetical protein
MSETGSRTVRNGSTDSQEFAQTTYTHSGDHSELRFSRVRLISAVSKSCIRIGTIATSRPRRHKRNEGVTPSVHMSLCLHHSYASHRMTAPRPASHSSDSLLRCGIDAEDHSICVTSLQFMFPQVPLSCVHIQEALITHSLHRQKTLQPR